MSIRETTKDRLWLERQKSSQKFIKFYGRNVTNERYVTFSTLHALDEDPSALREDPEAAAVPILPVAHGAQSVRRLEKLPSDQILLLQTHKRASP